jgi:hypothetical protein
MAIQASQTQPANWTTDPMAAAVVDAFMLGWDITELKARLCIANELTQAQGHTAEQAAIGDLPSVSGPKVEQAIGDRSMLASKWRALFVQIGSIHCRRFPGSTTKGTLYEPPSGLWAEALGYLYPEGTFPRANPPVPLPPDQPQYACLGLSGGSATVGCDLTPFTLFDATRRALNCLILLYTTSEDSLIAHTIDAYQEQLIARVVGTAANADDDARRCQALATITADTVHLLAAWESYLLEKYYAGRTLDNEVPPPNGSQIPRDAVAEQNGFEAGRSLAALTWNVSIAVAVDECRDLPPRAKSALPSKLRSSWCTALSQHNILAAQHAVAALSTALDDAYYRASGQSPPAAADDQGTGNGSATFNPDLPSSVCTIVSRSLDFWQRAVEWLARPPNVAKPSDLTKPSDSEPSYTPTLSANLHNALIEQSNVWQGLMTGQQKLQAYTVESVMHQILRKARDEFQQEAASRLEQASKAELRRFRRELGWIAAAVAVVLAIVVGTGIVWILVARPTLSSLNPNGIWSMFALGPILAGFLGMRAARPSTAASVSTASGSTAPPAPAATPAAGSAVAQEGLLQELDSWMGKAGGVLYSMWQAAYEQVRREFAFLNHVVGVAYPLVECFLPSSDGSEDDADRPVVIGHIKTDYDFVEQVIWSSAKRRQELEDIVAAAFQPLRLAIGAGVTALTTRNSSTTASK